MIAWAVLIVSVILFAHFFFCFFRAFVAQYRLIVAMAGTHELDDPDWSGSDSLMGLKPPKETTSFFYRTDPTALRVRSEWSRALGRLALIGAVLFVWLGLMYGLLEIEDATSGQKCVVDGRLQ